ncbi:MAG: hypothetical protein ACFFAU_12830, partial [Candidatus Hodarchaeota archaeon]
ETTNLPFDYISVSKPKVTPNWAKVGDTLNITEITAYISNVGPINDSIITNHTYEIIDFDSSDIVLTGDLIYNNNSQTWEANNIGITSLTQDKFYSARARFNYQSIVGVSKLSQKFWYGNSDPPIDLTPPTISSILQSPLKDAIIRSTDIVNVSCLVEDESGILNVTLSYHNGSWFKVLMQFQSGLYIGSIPPQNPGKTIQYKITAIDNSPQQNSNTTNIFQYVIALEYSPGQGIIPLIGISGIIVGAVVIALRAASMHRQKYDQV